MKRVQMIALVFVVGFCADATVGGAQTCGLRCEAICCNQGCHLWNNASAHNATGTEPHDCQCVGYHGGCLDSFNTEAKEAYRDLAAAAKNGNATAILTAAARAPDYVIVNRERQTLMILSCHEGIFIANVPYSDDEGVLRLARKLEDIQAMKVRYAAVVSALVAVGSR